MAVIQKQFGENLRKFRKRQGLTQEELAERVKMDFTTINKIENGKRNPSLKSMEKIARALKVSLKELLP